MNIIAIDCGASFVKGVLFENGNCKKKINYSSPGVSVNFLDKNKQIFETTKLVRRMLETLSEGVDNAVLAISNEMHGFLLADETGKPVIDYISWQKEYGSNVIEDKSALGIIGSSEFANNVKNTGMPLRAGLPSVNLLYLSLSGVLDGIEEDVYFFTLGDYILFNLSGSVPFCHPTNAAATGLYSIIDGNWDRTLIDLAIGKNQHIKFPHVGTSSTRFSLFGTEFIALSAIGDQQAALLGADFSEQEELSFNIGTGGQVSVIIEQPVLSDNYQIRPYFFDKYLKTIPHIPSGRAVNVYVRFIKDILSSYGCTYDESYIWDVILKSVKKTKESCLSVDLSFFENAVTDKSKGNITEISEYGLNMGSLFYSVFNQIADNYVDKAKLLIDPDNVKMIRFSGGLAGRIEIIRERILDGFNGGIAYYVFEGDTLSGLKKYCQMEVV